MVFVRTGLVLATLIAAAFVPASVEAKLFKSQPGPTPEAMPMPTPDPGLGYGTAPVPAGICCPTPCITYRHSLLPLCKVKSDPCRPPIEVVLCVANPCTCCPVNVPVCLPNCCCDAPVTTCRKALRGDSIVTYSWCCGAVVDVRFKKCGDVAVTYRGF